MHGGRESAAPPLAVGRDFRVARAFAVPPPPAIPTCTIPEAFARDLTLHVLRDARVAATHRAQTNMESSLMQHYMQDSDKMFKVYKDIGGVSTFGEYEKHLKMFYYHTINSHCGGVGPELYDGASIDEHGFALHDGRAAAEAAFMNAAQIEYAELIRIFKSVDTIHAYS